MASLRKLPWQLWWQLCCVPYAYRRNYPAERWHWNGIRYRTPREWMKQKCRYDIYIHIIICMYIYIYTLNYMYIYMYNPYIYIMNKRANGYGASKKGLDGVQWLRTKTRINKQPECIRKMRTWAVTRGISQKQSILYYKPSRLAVPGGKPSWMAMQRLAVAQQHLDLFQNTDTKIPKFIMFTPWSSMSP